VLSRPLREVECAVAEFADGYRGDGDLGGMLFEPVEYGGFGVEAEWFRDHVGVRDDHRSTWRVVAGRVMSRASPRRSSVSWSQLVTKSGSTASFRMARTSASMDRPWRAARSRRAR